MSSQREGSNVKNRQLVRILAALGVGLWAAPAFAICGDGEVEVAEECDDGNLFDGDGCSMACTVEDGFVCEPVSFELDLSQSLDVSGTSANFVVDSPTVVRQTANSIPAVFNTTMPADIAAITFDMSVQTTGDDDFIGWTVGWDSGELASTGTPATTDWLYFSWKQGTQTALGGSRQSGLTLSRVTGNVTEGQMWSGDGGNVTRLAEANSFPLAGGSTSGWQDNRKYRVRMIFSPDRIRVWITPETVVGSNLFLPANEALEFDVTPASVSTTTFPTGNLGFYVHSQPAERYELIGPTDGSVCSVDTDGDGVKDRSDFDSDKDGIPDLIELPSFSGDPDVDTDIDGVPDWNDPDHVPGGCPPAATVPPTCASLPAAVDPDGDGVPNHLDLDSDGDGITDAREAGLLDTDGDGESDDCTTVDGDGVCDSGGLPGAAPDTDGTVPDFLDTDSDDDGLADTLEAFDTDGDGTADVSPAGNDHDDDGVDDAFDPDCIGPGSPAGCAAAGLPVVTPLTGAQDADGNGTPDWLQVCRDGYVTAPEVCDDGNAVDDDGCSNVCLLGTGEPCTTGADCDGAICDPDDMVCSVCVDDMAGAAVDTGCVSATPVCDAVGVPNVCTVCTDNAAAGVTDDGCGGATPICDVSGATPTCVGCSGDADCGAGLVCVANACVPCEDSMTGGGVDRGCAASAPLCDPAGPVCEVCLDDTSGGLDLGCAASAPACDTSGASNTCTLCEDDATGVMVDNGCDASSPVCDDSGAPACVECTIDDHCPGALVCGPSNFCAPGCTMDSDCAATPDVPVCDTGGGICVGCVDDDDCGGITTCNPRQECVFGDNDGDGVTDEVDLDDDNDGVLDQDELGGTDLSADSDDDGVPDYLDPDAVTCTDGDSDGLCDALPLAFDADGDGVANHLDRDADGDGLVDLVEGGGSDGDADGLVDGFADGNGDGVDDGIAAAPLTLPDTDSDVLADFLDRDSDGDGITDTREANGADADGDGRLDGATDADGDGLADSLLGAALVGPDTDGDGALDGLDVDSDGDDVPDSVEGHLGTEAAGMDTDGDGIDDAYDADCTDCAGVVGVIAALPDTDVAGGPDFRDVDADGDGIADGAECPMPAMCFDADGDDTPDFRETDADDDGLDDAVEGHDVDLDGSGDVAPSGVDSDGDGLDDAYDADCADAADCGGVIGVVAPIPDTDSDMRPNFQDPDDDGDGRETATEIQDAIDYSGPATDPNDIDEDGESNWYDTDSDGDGALDMTENQGDGDANDDGLLDYLDPMFAAADSDGDGILDVVECDGVLPVGDSCRDSDGDGAPDYLDPDDDNDGLATLLEFGAPDPDDGDPANDRDADNDGVPNHLDLDADGDGIPDLWENGGADLDADGDGRPDDGTDADGDGVLAVFDADDDDAAVVSLPDPVDTDMTGQPDALDLDADGDGITDIVESGGTDSDGDGKVDDDTDSDGDGLADGVDPDDGGTPRTPPDTDDDGAADYQDVDSDGDGVRDDVEGHDANADGVADTDASGSDLDGDGIDDAFDPSAGGMAAPLPDNDGDGTPDWRDDDDDGDGSPSATEGTGDLDDDGTPDYLDPDDDGDGIATADEIADGSEHGNDVDGDGEPNWRDTDSDGDGLDDATEGRDDADGDGVPAYLDPDEGPMMPTTEGGYSGGALCAASDTGAGDGFGWLLLVGLALWRRRRAS